jgi:hypothetical protein
VLRRDAMRVCLAGMPWRRTAAPWRGPGAAPARSAFLGPRASGTARSLRGLLPLMPAGPARVPRARLVSGAARPDGARPASGAADAVGARLASGAPGTVCAYLVSGAVGMADARLASGAAGVIGARLASGAARMPCPRRASGASLGPGTRVVRGTRAARAADAASRARAASGAGAASGTGKVLCCRAGSGTACRRLTAPAPGRPWARRLCFGTPAVWPRSADSARRRAGAAARVSPPGFPGVITLIPASLIE